MVEDGVWPEENGHENGHENVEVNDAEPMDVDSPK